MMYQSFDDAVDAGITQIRQIQIFAERLVVKAAWMVPVTLLNRTLPLNFSLDLSTACCLGRRADLPMTNQFIRM